MGLSDLEQDLGIQPSSKKTGLAALEEDLKKPEPPSTGRRLWETAKTAVRPVFRGAEAGGREIVEGAKELNPFGRGTEGPLEAASRTLGGGLRILNAPVAAAGEFLASPALETEAGQRRPTVGGVTLPSAAEALRAIGQGVAAVVMGTPREKPSVIGPRTAPRGPVAAGGRDWPGTEPLALEGPPGVNWQYGRRAPAADAEATVIRSRTEPIRPGDRALPGGPSVAGELPPHVDWRTYEGPQPTLPRGAPELPPHVDWRRYEGPPPPEQIGLELSGSAPTPTPESVAAGTPQTASGAPAGPPPSSVEVPPRVFAPRVEAPTPGAPPAAPGRIQPPPGAPRARRGDVPWEEAGQPDLSNYDHVARLVRARGRIKVTDDLRGELKDVPWHFKSGKGQTLDRMAESLVDDYPGLGERGAVKEQIIDTLARGQRRVPPTTAEAVPDWVTEDLSALKVGEQVQDLEGGRAGRIAALTPDGKTALLHLDSGEQVGVPVSRLTRPGELEEMGFSSAPSPGSPATTPAAAGPHTPGESTDTPGAPAVPPESPAPPQAPGAASAGPPRPPEPPGAPPTTPPEPRGTASELLRDLANPKVPTTESPVPPGTPVGWRIIKSLPGLGMSASRQHQGELFTIVDPLNNRRGAFSVESRALEELGRLAPPEAPSPPPTPRFEPTQAGTQGVIGGTPGRELPDRPLRAPRPQADIRDTELFGQERAARERALEEAQGDLTRPPDPTTNPLTDETGALNLSRMVKAWKRWRGAYPMEKEVIRQRPNSPVINEVERWNTGAADGLQAIVEQPWWQGTKSKGSFFRRGGVQRLNPDVLKDLEEQAVQDYIANGRTRAAGMHARRFFPPEIQEMFRRRDAGLARENASRKYFGLEPIPEETGPYLPRKTVAESREEVSLGGGQLGVGRGLQTSVGGHQQRRIYSTYRQGEAAGTEYIDPRNAIIYREWQGLKVRATHRLFQNLEQKGGLYRRQADAAAASPTGKPWKVNRAPGGDWYTATEAEAKFLEQNLTDSGHAGVLLPTFVHYGNMLIRNPNLLLGIPHVTKNMWWKGILARGPEGLVTFPRDAWEYFRNTNPAMKAEFERTMPFSTTGRTAGDILGQNLIRETNAGKAAQVAGNVLRMAGRPSNKLVFEWGDPAMRYSLYKYYRTRGKNPLGPEAAANEAWVDLVRYGTRGDMIDAWKKWPMNFFVPWRYGTFTSLLKQAKNHPVRTALLIGGVDYLREVNYRQRGKWLHMPHDYIENPIAIGLQDRDAATIAGIAASTYAFGPGGAFTAGQLADVMKDMQGRGEYQRFLNMFWGISQIYNLGQEFNEFRKTGDPKIAFDMLTTALLAEHNAYSYQPRRLMSGLPEWLPGMKRSSQVRQAEAIQDKRKAVRERIEQRRKARPRPTIEEIVGARP